MGDSKEPGFFSFLPSSLGFDFVRFLFDFYLEPRLARTPCKHQACERVYVCVSSVYAAIGPGISAITSGPVDFFSGPRTSATARPSKDYPPCSTYIYRIALPICAMGCNSPFVVWVFGCQTYHFRRRLLGFVSHRKACDCVITPVFRPQHATSSHYRLGYIA